MWSAGLPTRRTIARQGKVGCVHSQTRIVNGEPSPAGRRRTLAARLIGRLCLVIGNHSSVWAAMSEKQQAYLAYMLRLWQVGGPLSDPVWRAAVESPHTGERHVFPTLKDLFVFLAGQVAAATVCSPEMGAAGVDEVCPNEPEPDRA